MRKKLFSLEFPIVTLNLFFIPYTSRLLTIIPFSSSFFLNFLAEILHLSKFNNKKFAETLFVFILFFSKLRLSFSAHFLLCLIDFDINILSLSDSIADNSPIFVILNGGLIYINAFIISFDPYPHPTLKEASP